MSNKMSDMQTSRTTFSKQILETKVIYMWNSVLIMKWLMFITIGYSMKFLITTFLVGRLKIVPSIMWVNQICLLPVVSSRSTDCWVSDAEDTEIRGAPDVECFRKGSKAVGVVTERFLSPLLGLVVTSLGELGVTNSPRRGKKGGRGESILKACRYGQTI